MKKSVVVLLLLSFILSFVGCEAKAVVSSAVLTDREQALVGAMSNNSYIFDYNAAGYSIISAWAEKYCKGEKAGVCDLAMSWTCENGSKGTIIFYHPLSKTGALEQLNVTVIQGGVRYNREDAIPGYGEDLSGHGILWETDPSNSIPDNGKKLLLVIRLAENGWYPLSDEFFKDYDNNLSDIQGDDITYIIGCTFTQ